jgi:hypothetical protein
MRMTGDFFEKNRILTGTSSTNNFCSHNNLNHLLTQNNTFTISKKQNGIISKQIHFSLRQITVLSIFRMIFQRTAIKNMMWERENYEKNRTD